MSEQPPPPEDLPGAALRAYRASRPRRRKLFTGFAVLFAVGLGVLVWAWTDQSAFDGRKQPTTAHVEARHGHRGGHTLDLVLTVGGHEYRTGLRDADGRVGQDIEVFYDPEDPTEVTAPGDSLHGRLIAYSAAGTAVGGLMVAVFAFGAAQTRRVARGPWRTGTVTARTPNSFHVEFADGTGTALLRTRHPLPDGYRTGAAAVQHLRGGRWLYVLANRTPLILPASGQPPPTAP
ncbi:hypothetical protein L6E12_12095 [Actinokineospora sp. PR83]|uniref:hypothetical protein n=1 Tax=Actinokineospora sp. PR83 TaxID=2884908 RepID=UPI001F3270B5|nr:hypothetical protein [Actinokineospora sp. PR83]MCG8916530.1 hypothetical protein [Actinokineospora sp. PR83]